MLFWSRHTWSSRFKATNGGCENAKSVTDAAISALGAVAGLLAWRARTPPSSVETVV